MRCCSVDGVVVGSSSPGVGSSRLLLPPCSLLPDRPRLWTGQRDPGRSRGRVSRQGDQAHQGKKKEDKAKSERKAIRAKRGTNETAFSLLNLFFALSLSPPLKKKKKKQVYHVPKKPELDLLGRTGTVAEVVRFYQGAELSATMPYRVVLDDDDEAKAAAAGGKKPLKVTVHLSGGEIELLA